MSNNNSGGGITFLGLLQILFITLKLCKVIAWSWLWVLTPIWIPILIAVVGIGCVFSYLAIKELIKK